MTDSLWAPDGGNLVVHADNAEFLPSLPDGAFTLIYVDPPFNTGRVQKRQETRMVLNTDGDGDRVGFKGVPTTPSRAPCTGTMTPSVITGHSWNPGSWRPGGCWPTTARCTSTWITGRSITPR
ncbi:hypothetical protein AHiyo4_33720 [Arthrobacter sp. Hiyo4]|nr:hypothetical protein AHiyo4_33720 [Arthrobacter sp. Hiyo4]